MKKVRVLYRDDPSYSGGRPFEYTTSRSYTVEEARSVAENLEVMGCHSIRFVPEERAA